MEKVSWKDKKTNEEMLALLSEERGLVQSVMKRKQTG
jgi:hypothetical protein